MLAVAEAEAQNQQTAKGKSPDAPRLVVNITIDQLRTDYLEAFMPLYGNAGFKRLLENGLVFSKASYPFLPVDRASAIAAVASGSVPYDNGIPSVEWLSRKTLRPMQSITDLKSLIQPRGSAPTPVNLVTSTIGDELKIATQRAAKVYSIATECDAAVLSAGHAADAAIWLDKQTGQWTTSTYYSKLIPDWLIGYNKNSSVVKKLKSAIWKPKSDAVQKMVYFPASPTQPKTFSYTFAGTTAYSDYITSGLINSDVTDMALQCVNAAQLGQDNIPDLLNLQYYAGTFRQKGAIDAGIELQDTYARLDEAIGLLITAVEGRVGKGRVLFVVTSTGYFDETPMDYTTYGVPSGTVYINRTAHLLNMYLGAHFGTASYVDGYRNNQIYLNHKVIEQKKLKMAEVMERSREMLLLSDGIRGVNTSLSLATTSDASLLPLRNGYNTAVSGDILLDIAPGWKLLNEDTHQLSNWSIQGIAFPIIIYGCNIQHENVSLPVTTDQIAPTITKSIRIRAPNACKNTPLH